jgi:hypothetical protein
MNENKIIAIESTVFQKLNSLKYRDFKNNPCIDKNFNSNKFNIDICAENYDFLKPYLDQLHQLKPADDEKSNLLMYFLIFAVTIEFLIIIIMSWKCETKKGKIEPHNFEVDLQPANDSHPNGSDFNYASLVLKPSNRTPIRIDEVIYSEVHN